MKRGDPLLSAEKVQAAITLGLIAECPECEGTGDGFTATTSDGKEAIHFGCDCSGFGFYCPPATAALMRRIVDFVNSLDEQTPITGKAFPEGWAHHGVLLLVEHLSAVTSHNETGGAADTDPANQRP